MGVFLCRSTEPPPRALDPLFEELCRAKAEKQRGAPLSQDDRLGHRYLRALTSAHRYAQAGPRRHSASVILSSYALPKMIGTEPARRPVEVVKLTR